VREERAAAFICGRMASYSTVPLDADHRARSGLAPTDDHLDRAGGQLGVGDGRSEENRQDQQR
jgi:hypothetical protein